MLVRSWNLFHGNTSPPSSSVYLEEMVRLACADRPDVLVLQEVPAWALDELARWSGMTAVGDVSQRPRLGPMPITAGLGRRLTDLSPGLLRSAFSGQGNAILLGDGRRVVLHEVVPLNPTPFRRQQAHRLGLDLVTRLAWGRNDASARSCACPTASSSPTCTPRGRSETPDPAAELRRAVPLIDAVGDSAPGDGVLHVRHVRFDSAFDVLAGVGRVRDHIAVRGAEPSAIEVWPDERRLRNGMLLSDHPPIELEL